MLRETHHLPLLMTLLNHPAIPSLLQNPFLVRLDVPRKRFHRSVIAHPQVSAHVRQHRDVVRHHEHASPKLSQCVAERVHRLNVQVVRRLVQHEDVWILQAEAGKGHATFFDLLKATPSFAGP